MITPVFTAGLYLTTVLVGLLGNLWVICSIARSRRQKGLLSRNSPSDRLRAYISVLAVIDLTVLMALLVRSLYLSLPHFMLDSSSCRAMFVLEHSVKLASLTVLACISIERYLTIRKPFCTEVRKRFVRLTPLIALFFASSGITTLLIQLPSVYVSTDSLNCVVSFRSRLAPRLASVFSSCFFLVSLSAISLNYFQIIRHVKRKFSKRKARVVATRQRENLISQPRYMAQMTSAIVRVGVFHFISWLPFCLLRLWPSAALNSELSANIRFFSNFTEFSPLRWAIFIANWLTYANAAGDWIFYAAMNKELRNLIRFATERRKRSTMTHVASPSNTHRSFKQQALQRVIQSISYRSSVGASQDDPDKNASASQDQASPQIIHSALLSTPSEPEFV